MTTSSDRRRRPRRISRITRRILAVNVMALVILVGGVLYMGEYRDKLVAAELGAMMTQAEMFAAALGEGAVIASDPGATLIARETARRMIRRLVSATRFRARLFSAEGDLIVDTESTGPLIGRIERESLPPPEEENAFKDEVFNLYNNLMALIPGGGEPPPEYFEKLEQKAVDYGEVSRAMYGAQAEMIRMLPDGTQILSVAVPVQRYKRILGAVMLSTDDRRVSESLFEVRLDILKISAGILGLTIFLSLYLAGTIARPLVRLSRAADRMRMTVGRQHQIPDMARRKDEIGDLSTALRDMTESLWHRMDAVERFAADVAHEIKNPLTSLRSAVETMARVKDPEQQKKLLAIIEEDVIRLDRLISDISDFSRLDAELSKSELESLDLERLVSGMVDAYVTTRVPDSDAPNVRLIRAVKGPLPVSGTEIQAGQVIGNIVENARTFSPPGGTVTLTLDRRGTEVVLTVDDEGPGIQPGKEEAIFDRFYSERPAGESFGTHSGLGLSIVQQIMQAFGGAVTASNRTDETGAVKGARFTLRFQGATMTGSGGHSTRN